MSTHASSKARLACAVVAIAAACGDSLIRDPSFELWCGERLCAPWESQGRIERVGTWHDDDYGVALRDGAELSQVSDHAAVECIEFAVIADVDASAEVWLELDFQDDGRSEYRQPIPESHWARLTFLVPAPTWYDHVRFIVRKEGRGRAVLAQLAATSSSECEGPAIELVDRPNGARCDSPADCASGVCTPGPKRAPDDLGDGPPTCNGCGADAPCADFELCGIEVGDHGVHYACRTLRSAELGAWCEAADECSSGSCATAGASLLAVTTCSECAGDADCDPGQTCVTQVREAGAARVCAVRKPGAAPLGELCTASDECASGVCCDGSCSECCRLDTCAGGAQCGSAADDVDGWTMLPSLCDPGSAARERGEACTGDADCRSGDCDGPRPECLLRVASEASDPNCRKGVARRLAGVCR